MKDKFFEIHDSKFQIIKSTQNLNKILSISTPLIGRSIFVPSDGVSNKDYQKNLKRAYSTKSQIMTDLIQRLAMEMDGATMAGYLFPVMLLQIIVAADFCCTIIRLC